MSDCTGWTISVGMNPNDMGDLTGYDEAASISRFREFIEQQMANDYPGAEINVYYNDGLMSNKIVVIDPANPEDEHDDEVVSIGDRIGSIFARGDWAITAANYQLPTLRCLRCGHEWHPRTARAPRFCSKCNSPYWNKPRQRERAAND